MADTSLYNNSISGMHINTKMKEVDEMLSKKNRYRTVYYDGFMMPRTTADVSIYKYLILGRDYIWDNVTMADKTLTLMKLCDGHGEQLLLTADRDFYELNWQRYENGEKVESISIQHWQSLSLFENFSYKDFELWILSQWEYFQQTHKRLNLLTSNQPMEEI